MFRPPLKVEFGAVQKENTEDTFFSKSTTSFVKKGKNSVHKCLNYNIAVELSLIKCRVLQLHVGANNA